MSDGAVAEQASSRQEGWFRISAHVKWHYITRVDPVVSLKVVTACFRCCLTALPNRLKVVGMLPEFAKLCAMCASQRGVYLNNNGTVRLDQAQ